MKIVSHLAGVLKTALRILRGNRPVAVPLGVKKERNKSLR
jgi:hypothetical protein